jgi:parallel beta-helix repeat protein
VSVKSYYRFFVILDLLILLLPMKLETWRTILSLFFPKLPLVIVIITIYFSSISTEARNFYFSTISGDDNRTINQAQNPLTPWKTISKLNSFFGNLIPGDSILFNRNELFNGTIIITKSGSLNNPITIGAYGIGNKPVINGFTTLGSWTNEGNGIYSNLIQCESSPEMVTINGIQYGAGRYPNTGHLNIDSHVATVSISDSDLNSLTTNWTGAEIVIRKNHYILDRCYISNHTNQTITYTNLGSTVEPYNGWGYFIQKDVKTLDQFGEWYYGNGKFYMYFGTETPENSLVKVSSIDKLFFNNGNKYIQIRDLSFQGANKYAIHFSNAADFGLISNCDILFSGEDGINFSSKYGIVSNCFINNINQTGIYTNSSFITIIDNTINKCGLVRGAARRGDYSIGILAYGSDNLYQYNSIDSVGYNGIYLVSASRSIVKNNLINHFCLNLNDGGGIYTAGTTSIDRVIDGNIILNGIGNLLGTNGTLIIVEGIYIDEPTSDIDIRNNTCAFNAYSGLKLHNTNNIRVNNNTFYANNICSIRIQESNSNTPVRLNNIHQNKCIIKYNELVLKHFSVTNDVGLIGGIDTNYYAAPFGNQTLFQIGQPASGTINMNFPEWQAYSNYDLNSIKSQVTISNPNDILFVYNLTKTISTTYFYGTYIDVKGIIYVNSITLEPYNSSVLMKVSTNGNQSPTISNQSFNIAENSANGTNVGTVIASDPDAGQTLTYSILSGNISGAFTINASTGLLTVANSSALNCWRLVAISTDFHQNR